MLKHVRCHFKLIFDISWLWWETVSWILWTEESSWDILNKKSAVFHWKAENVKTGLYIQFPKMMLMDSGVVCDGTLLHWGNLLKVYTHSKTWKPRMSGILFSFGNSQFKICFIFMLILLLNIRLAVRHLWSPKMLG